MSLSGVRAGADRESHRLTLATSGWDDSVNEMLKAELIENRRRYVLRCVGAVNRIMEREGLSYRLEGSNE